MKSPLHEGNRGMDLASEAQILYGDNFFHEVEMSQNTWQDGRCPVHFSGFGLGQEVRVLPNFQRT